MSVKVSFVEGIMKMLGNFSYQCKKKPFPLLKEMGLFVYGREGCPQMFYILLVSGYDWPLFMELKLDDVEGADMLSR